MRSLWKDMPGNRARNADLVEEISAKKFGCLSLLIVEPSTCILASRERGGCGVADHSTAR